MTKRALIAIPLSALLIGLLLFLWHRASGLALAPKAGPSEKAEPPSPAPAVSKPQDPAPSPPPSSPASTGGVRFIVTAKGQPVAGATVFLQQGETESVMKFLTPTEGIQTVLNLPPIEFGYGVRHPKYLPVSHKHIDIVAGRTLDVKVDLELGGRIHGTVVDGGGNPLKDTSIFLADPEQLSPVSLDFSTKTDDQGKYVLYPVPPGEFSVRIRHSRYKVWTKRGLVFHGPQDEYEVNAVLQIGARVGGRVVDELGAPIEGADVLVGNPQSGGVTKTDKDGSFLISGLVEDALHCSAAKKGYGTVYRRFVAPETMSLLFQLPRAGILAGRIAVEPQPEHFCVMLVRYEPDVKRHLRVQTQFFTNTPGGRFLVPDVAPGEYAVEVECAEHEALDQPRITVNSGQTTSEVVVRLRKKS